MKKPVSLELDWSEAANLLVAANAIVEDRAKMRGWTPAARGVLRRAVLKLAVAIPMDDNGIFLVVKGQTPL
jgi:hypothetical protein